MVNIPSDRTFNRPGIAGSEGEADICALSSDYNSPRDAEWEMRDSF